MITPKQPATNQKPKRYAEAWAVILAKRDAETAADKEAGDRAEAKGKAYAATLAAKTNNQ